MKTAIYSLYQRKEFDRTKFFIKNIKKQLNNKRQLFILINDSDDENLRKFCQNESRFINILTKGYNLGVASGRNYLLESMIKLNYNFFISSDNDIIYEKNYYKKLEQSYIKLKKKNKNIGLIQPILLDGRKFRDFFNITSQDSWSTVSTKIEDFDFKTLKNNFIKKKSEIDFYETYYHTGISNIWKAHFNAEPKSILFDLNEYKTNHATLRADLELLKSLSSENNFVKIASTAGGVSAFDRDFIKRNGLYRALFDPFLYEDSEFGFRSFIKKDNNFLILDCCAIHDIFMNSSTSVSIDSNRNLFNYTNIAKLRASEYMNDFLSKDEKYFILKQSLVFEWKKLLTLIKDDIQINSKINNYDNFLLKYYLNFLFGMCNDSFKIPNIEYPKNIFSYIFQYINFENLNDLVIPLTDNLNFNIGNFLILNHNTKVLALSGMNAYFGDTKYNTRFFDFYITITHEDKQDYTVNIDIQSNEKTWNSQFKLNMKLLLSDNMKESCISNIKYFNKNYDFGSFSKEDIYPKPSLTEKAKIIEVALKPIYDIFRLTNSLVTKSILHFSGYSIKTKTIDKVSKNKKILIFTDSRGQHIPSGYSHEIFPNKLKSELTNFDIDLVLCPMKWTTTLDFIEYSEINDLSAYDYIILYTGIVEWSPRPQKSAKEDLYNNQNIENLKNWNLNTRNYSKKIVNNKKKIFDKLFGEKNINKYLDTPFSVTYEGEKTINLYSKEMLRDVIGPYLKKFDNLIFINSNKIVKDWEGDFKRGRPSNISIIHEYSEILSSFFPPDRLIDLRKWNNEEIKKYTCDNMHLTDKGSEFILKELIKKVDENGLSEFLINKKYFEQQVSKDISKLISFKKIEKFSKNKKNIFLKKYTEEKYLATLIIGIRLNKSDLFRLINFEFLLKWLDYYYGEMFDILIVEQDSKRKLNKNLISEYNNVRYEFLYNPLEYNRGWGYNVAVKHFCSNSKVVALMDTDVLTGSSFVADIRDCYINRYKVISPYQNVYYSDKKEAEHILKVKNIENLKNSNKIKNPVTITGGIVIFDRKTYLDLKGFEQYRGYGCEDRSLDVMLLEFINSKEIKISQEVYVHLYHISDQEARENFDEIYNHLIENYDCQWSPKLEKTDFIHSRCNHVDKEKLTKLLIEKNKNFGDINLYRNKNITINGRVKNDIFEEQNIMLPPTFSNLKDYSKKELYEAPDADINQLEKFRNAFLGERCFIIGNGPSLNKHDLSLLENEYSFGVNSFYYKTRETGFRPTFYVVEDTSVMKENLKEIKDYHAPFKFFPTIYKRLHPKDPNTFFFTMNRGFYEKSSPNYCVPRFSTDATKELFCGQSVTYINLQLAYFMGFTEIYLIGMDFSYIIPDSHKRTGDVLLSDSDDENHFHKDYFGKGKTWKDPKLDRVGNNYRMAKLVFESTGRKIYNATVGGSLEIFNRIDYYSLFDKTKENKIELSLGNFVDANKLFLEQRYTDALVVYLKLVEEDPKFIIYKQALLNCYLKAKDNGQPIQEEIVNRIKRFI